jgi:hypothetical protein
MTYIYALTEPETEEIRYIGKADNLNKRYTEHLSYGKNAKNKTHRASWLRHLMALGKQPDVLVLEECDSSDWQAHEREWIALGRLDGLDLVNGTVGGDGVNGHRMTDAGKAIVSASKVGNNYAAGKRTDEQRLRMSQAAKGRKLSAEHRANVSKGLREHYSANPLPDTQKQHVSDGIKAWWATRKHGQGE